MYLRQFWQPKYGTKELAVRTTNLYTCIQVGERTYHLSDNDAGKVGDQASRRKGGDVEKLATLEESDDVLVSRTSIAVDDTRIHECCQSSALGVLQNRETLSNGGEESAGVIDGIRAGAQGRQALLLRVKYCQLC